MAQLNENTLIKLHLNIKVIGNLQDNQTINISGENLVAQTKDYHSALYRKLNGENRHKCFMKIKDTINYAILTVELLINSKYVNNNYISCDNHVREWYIEWINKYLDAIFELNFGLVKYCDSYHGDNEFIIEINQLIEEIDYKKKYLAELFKDIEISSVV